MTAAIGARDFLEDVAGPALAVLGLVDMYDHSNVPKPTVFSSITAFPQSQHRSAVSALFCNTFPLLESGNGICLKAVHLIPQCYPHLLFLLRNCH